jgi:hypothetical protein
VPTTLTVLRGSKKETLSVEPRLRR